MQPSWLAAEAITSPLEKRRGQVGTRVQIFRTLQETVFLDASVNILPDLHVTN